MEINVKEEIKFLYDDLMQEKIKKWIQQLKICMITERISMEAKSKINQKSEEVENNFKTKRKI